MKQKTLALESAANHARSVYPEESCGFVVDGEYFPVDNKATDPANHVDDPECPCRLCSFKISKADSAKFMPNAEMIVHSHPNGPHHPSRADMMGQLETDIPWAIITLDEDRTSEAEIWGEQVEKAPILGREFLHGIRDCYSIIRDVYAAGREGLKEQGVTSQWPLDPIHLDEVARQDAWWEEEGVDMYNMLPSTLGWEEVKGAPQVGDVFLMKIRSKKFNHAGILITEDLICHHLPGRFSRREPAGLWARQAGRWIRYTGENDA